MLKLLTHIDMPAVLAYLTRHPVEAAFLLGNVLVYGVENRTPEGRSGDYFGFYRGSELSGIISFYNLGSCIPHFEHEGAAEEFSAIMMKRNYRILLGFRSIISPLAERLEGRKHVREISECEYMLCHQFKPFVLSEAEFRTVPELGENRAVDFAASAYRHGLDGLKSRHEIAKMFHEHSGNEEFLFLVVNDDIKAQAYIQTSTPRIVQIGGIYTSEEERGRGYSKAIASEFCTRIIKKGSTPSLVVRQDNLPAKKAYEHIGFNYYGDYLIVRL